MTQEKSLEYFHTFCRENKLNYTLMYTRATSTYEVSVVDQTQNNYFYREVCRELETFCNGWLKGLRTE